MCGDAFDEVLDHDVHRDALAVVVAQTAANGLGRVDEQAGVDALALEDALIVHAVALLVAI